MTNLDKNGRKHCIDGFFNRILDDVSKKDILKVIRENLEKYFNQLKISYDFTTEDSYLCILTDKTGVVVTVRFYLSKGLIAINVDYYNSACRCVLIWGAIPKYY